MGSLGHLSIYRSYMLLAEHAWQCSRLECKAVTQTCTSEPSCAASCQSRLLHQSLQLAITHRYTTCCCKSCATRAALLPSTQTPSEVLLRLAVNAQVKDSLLHASGAQAATAVKYHDWIDGVVRLFKL